MSLVSRNSKCPCGSGVKHKRCCLDRSESVRVTVTASGSITPWKPPSRLLPGAAQGSGARPAAQLDREVEDHEEVWQVAAPFSDWLRRRGELRRVPRLVDSVRQFLDYLSTSAGVPLAGLHEFDLRLFMADWYPRRSRSRPETPDQLREALKVFFVYLEESEGICCPWSGEVLGERKIFADRCRRWDSAAVDGLEEGRLWSEMQWHLLDRALVPEECLEEGLYWGLLSTEKELRLRASLRGHWLLWRDEIIRSGECHPGVVTELATEKQRLWERTNQSELGGRSPLEVVRTIRRSGEFSWDVASRSDGVFGHSSLFY